MDVVYVSPYQMTMELSHDEMQQRYPALFKRWLRSAAGKRWQREQERAEQKRQARLEKRREKDPNRKRPWTPAEKRILRDAWGTKTTAQIAKELGRSQRAVAAKAKRMRLGLAAEANGCMSLTQFSEHSGFSIQQIKRAAEVLGIRLSAAKVTLGREHHRHHNRRRQYQSRRAITPAQQHRILRELLKE